MTVYVKCHVALLPNFHPASVKQSDFRSWGMQQRTLMKDVSGQQTRVCALEVRVHKWSAANMDVSSDVGSDCKNVL